MPTVRMLPLAVLEGHAKVHVLAEPGDALERAGLNEVTILVKDTQFPPEMSRQEAEAEGWRALDSGRRGREYLVYLPGDADAEPSFVGAFPDSDEGLGEEAALGQLALSLFLQHTRGSPGRD
jgi:hypothetical protein